MKLYQIKREIKKQKYLPQKLDSVEMELLFGYGGVVMIGSNEEIYLAMDAYEQDQVLIIGNK